MDLEILSWMQSKDGVAFLHTLAGRITSEVDTLRELTRLRAHYPMELARAAVELVLLRRRARAKFYAADHLFFTREALEQASNETVATHRAARLATYGHIADLCCSIGGDALALAGVGSLVTALDRDVLRLAMAAANAAVLGRDNRITFIHADLLQTTPPVADAYFCDPGRRTDGRRRFHVEQYEPPLSHILAWRATTPALVVKLAPGVDYAELPTDSAIELEFVSLNGELKEATLWCGPLASVQRRATVLQSQMTPIMDYPDVEQPPHRAAPTVQAHTLVAAPQCPRPALVNPKAFLFEPDPAVIRAGLIIELATQLGIAQLDQHIAYLTGDDLIVTPFARVWRVLEWFPFNLKRLRARLRELDAGIVTVKKRGSPLDTDALARRLSGSGATPLVVILTRVHEQPAALICTNIALY